MPEYQDHFLNCRMRLALEFIGGRYLGQVRVRQRIEGQDKIIKPTLYIIRNHEKYDGMQGQDIAEHYKPFPYSWCDPRSVFWVVVVRELKLPTQTNLFSIYTKHKKNTEKENKPK